MRLMFHNSEVTTDNLVLQNGSWRDIDALSVVGDDNDGTLERDALSKPNVARNSQVIEFEDVRDSLETAQKVFDLK